MSRIDHGHVAQALVMTCGIWLMAAPDVLGFDAPMAHSDYIAGPLLVTIGGIAIWGIGRPARWAAIPVGVWLLVAPWILSSPLTGTISSSTTGVVAILMALVRGRTTWSFGGGWSALWVEPSPYRDLPPEGISTSGKRTREFEGR